MIGNYIQVNNNQHFKKLHIATMSPPTAYPLQAEALALVLSTKVAIVIQLQDPQFFSYCHVLVQAISTNILSALGNWEIRPMLATIHVSSFQANRVNHISKSLSVKAHYLARLTTRINSISLAIRCICKHVGLYPGKDILSNLSLNPFTLLSAKCC